MDTYFVGAQGFESSAKMFKQEGVNYTRASFGLITYQGPNTGITEVGQFCKDNDVHALAIWSNQSIEDSWETGLSNYLGTPQDRILNSITRNAALLEAGTHKF